MTYPMLSKSWNLLSLTSPLIVGLSKHHYLIVCAYAMEDYAVKSFISSRSTCEIIIMWLYSQQMTKPFKLLLPFNIIIIIIANININNIIYSNLLHYCLLKDQSSYLVSRDICANNTFAVVISICSCIRKLMTFWIVLSANRIINQTKYHTSVYKCAAGNGLRCNYTYVRLQT